jgi:glycosyltransferase
VKISVITVSFNSAKTIGQTLSSVDAQSHRSIEHIIVDGASIDGTVSIIDAHRQPWRHVRSERDRGIYDAMNKGLELATGDYVGFLNADDVLADADAIARLAQKALEARCDALYADLVYVGSEDTDVVVRRWRCGTFSHAALSRGWMPPHPTFYVRRSLLAHIGRFDIGMRIAADYEFMLRVLTRPDVTVAQVPGVMVRMRNGGASNGSVAALWQKSREDLRAIRRHGVGGLVTLLCKNARKLPQFLGDH